MPIKETCLIYGGGGFIGSHLSDSLLEKGYAVTVFDKLNFSKKIFYISLTKLILLKEILIMRLI